LHRAININRTTNTNIVLELVDKYIFFVLHLIYLDFVILKHALIMKLHIITTFLLLTYLVDFAGLKAQSLMYEWGVTSFGSNTANIPYIGFKRIATDADGNIYKLLEIDVRIDVAIATNINTYSATNGQSILLKYDPLGQLLWAKQAYGKPCEIQYANGHLYYTGTYSNGEDISFDSGVDTLMNNGFYDAFIMKMDTAANLIWVNGFGGAGYEFINSLDVADNGDVYISGYSGSTGSINISPNGTAVNINPTNENQIYIKYDASGQYVWHNQLPSDITGVTINQDNGHLYLSYIVMTTTTISGTVLTPISAMHTGVGISKVNSSNGNIEWSKCVGQARQLQPTHTINIHGDVTVFFIATQTSSPIDYDPSPNVFMLNHIGQYEVANVKFDTLGNFITAGALSGGSGPILYGVDTDINDNIYIMGKTGNEDSLDFDLTAATQNVAINANDNFYLAKYADDNSLIYYEISDFGAIYDANLHVDANNDIYIGGVFTDYVDIDLTAGVDSAYVNTAIIYNMAHFMTKYNQNGVVGVERQVVEAVKIYPNPATDKIIISQAQIGETLQIIDVMGRIISRQLVYAQEFEINTNHLSNGLYFFQIGKQTHKIVIAK
jgi:hypothetical protein